MCGRLARLWHAKDSDYCKALLFLVKGADIGSSSVFSYVPLRRISRDDGHSKINKSQTRLLPVFCGRGRRIKQRQE